MTTYIALFNLTEAGIKAAKDSPRRLDAAKKLLADMGGEMNQFYMVMGEFDFVGICEAPDEAVMARYVLQLGGLYAWPKASRRRASSNGITTQFMAAHGRTIRTNGHNFTEREGQARADDRQRQLHRIARPGRSRDDKMRRLPDRVERRAQEHEPRQAGATIRPVKASAAPAQWTPSIVSQTGLHGMSRSRPTPARNVTAYRAGGGIIARIGA